MNCKRNLDSSNFCYFYQKLKLLKMIQIKIGEQQPIECEICNFKYGYQYSDFMKVHYTVFHDSEGKHEGGAYSEGCTMLNKGITPYCTNCGHKLKFKLIRHDFEITEAKKYPKGSRFV